MWRGLSAALPASGAAATAFFLYRARTAPFLGEGEQEGALGALGALSRVAGQVDTVFALCAGYGRGMLHFKTGGWGDLRACDRCSGALAALARPGGERRERFREEIRAWLPRGAVAWDTDWEQAAPGVWRRDGSFETPMFRLFGARATRAIVADLEIHHSQGPIRPHR